ncbi:MAG: (Uracil-5)-methyltransferase [Gemmatimonadetes bacterium]|nr:(Uracil-5)-methyltransferase [Gemmatimonadota bacterium]
MSGAGELLTIESIAAGGDGVGRTAGMVVFVPRTAPGDVARVRITKVKRFGRGQLVSLDAPSPARVDPPCAHYTVDRCGGCQMQHLGYAAQLEAKSAIIGDSLRRIGRRDVKNPTVAPSDAPWRYRRKLTLHLRRTTRGWIAGLHPYDDPAAVFDLIDCPITDERVLAVWAELRGAFELLPRQESLRMSVRLLDEGAAATLEGGKVWPTSDQFFAAAPSLSELWWRAEGRGVQCVATRASMRQAGSSFAQVNAQVAEQLRSHLLERVRHYEPLRVVDAYAGTGATTLPLAADGRTVVAIEWDRAAVEQLRERLAPPSSAVAGRVEDHLGAALPADVVMLNPPRTGVDAAVTTALDSAAQPPRALFYVSCDPATLARDLARLPRYSLVDVRGYDMFPQTAHVETLCELVPVAE